MTRDQVLRARLEQMVTGGRQMLIAALKAIPLSLIVALITWLVLTKLEKKYEIIRSRKKVATGLAFYIMLLLQMGILQRPFGSERGIKWIPFITPGGDYLIVLYALANLIFFIPIGFLLVRTFSNKINTVWKVAIIALLISLFIEVMQYTLACGTSEVEDVIMNVAGGVVGYLVAKKFSRKK